MLAEKQVPELLRTPPEPPKPFARVCVDLAAAATGRCPRHILDTRGACSSLTSADAASRCAPSSARFLTVLAVFSARIPAAAASNTMSCFLAFGSSFGDTCDRVVTASASFPRDDIDLMLLVVGNETVLNLGYDGDLFRGRLVKKKKRVAWWIFWLGTHPSMAGPPDCDWKRA
eukprot:TRINITY_DN70763_c0_g1_i1.p2 TRINITY_DN70763_c0_g1~~TRINITY_DN70763_c0_g1_i1.p2  ORF type:complete len:173 (+),score=27.00 TRINITY_DN70763_c0_g1_i1:338-856(+)